ncbi:hypothetical protein [Amycolatopsis saalfeldensis]|uniref:hypothetical protein n=1 Tax=Amycolatopsis saalfeldensis TaxID=394193 RepID=UPI001160A650|nr:hypothetical protein [Amycolatopsis saalfeldensis]
MTARAYAVDGVRGRPSGAIWTALVEPDRLLARNRDRDEFEYVVDTAGLTIEPVRRRCRVAVPECRGRAMEGVEPVGLPSLHVRVFSEPGEGRCWSDRPAAACG